MTTKRQRAEIRRLEMTNQGLLSQSWRVVEAAFRARLTALLADIGEQLPSANQVSQLERFRSLLEQTEAVIAMFAMDVERAVLSAQNSAVQFGASHASDLLDTALANRLPFVRLPVEAVNQFVGMLSGGNSLHTYLSTVGVDARKRVSDTLVFGVANGTNTNALAPQIMQALEVSRNSATVTARQAVYGAYRGASLVQYRANGNLLDGWTWISALQTRTCALCWALHGTVHTLEETLDSHLSCRCTMAPKTKSWKDLGFTTVPERAARPTGVEAFAKLGEAQQREVLGQGKYELYQAGKLKLPDLVERTNSDKWGRGRRERALREVV